MKQPQTPAFRWCMMVLGVLLVACSLLLTLAYWIPGLIGAALGAYIVYRFSPHQSDVPVYRRKWVWVIGGLWLLCTIGNVTTAAPSPTGISLPPAEVTLDVKDTTTLPISLEPSDAAFPAMEFSSSDESVIQVELTKEDGEAQLKLTPVGEGTASVYASYKDVVSNTVAITVIDEARIAAEEEAARQAEEEAARKAAEEEAARKAAEEEAARQAEEEAARKAAEEEAARQAAEEEAARQAEEAAAAQQAASGGSSQQSTSGTSSQQSSGGSSSQAAGSQSAAQGTMVWIPRSGSKYHSHASCSNMKSPTQVTRAEAEAMGYEPCKKCY